MPLNPYLKHVKRTLEDVKRFPHRLAAEYPEEWLCRVLAALEIMLKNPGDSSGLTRQYSITYLQVAQVALKETLAERIKFFQENTVLAAEEVRAENESLKDQVARLRAENALLAELVRARSHTALDRVSGTLQSLAKESPDPAARPSPPPLVVRSTPLGIRSARSRLIAQATPERSVSDHLADLEAQRDQGSSDT